MSQGNIVERLEYTYQIKWSSPQTPKLFFAVRLESELLSVNTHHQFITNGLVRQWGWQLSRRFVLIAYCLLICYTNLDLSIYFTKNIPVLVLQPPIFLLSSTI